MLRALRTNRDGLVIPRVRALHRGRQPDLLNVTQGYLGTTSAAAAAAWTRNGRAQPPAEPTKRARGPPWYLRQGGRDGDCTISRLQLRGIPDECTRTYRGGRDGAGKPLPGPSPTDVAYLEMLHAVQPGSVYGIWRHEEKLRHLIKKRFQWWIPASCASASSTSTSGAAGVSPRATYSGLGACSACRRSRAPALRVWIWTGTVAGRPRPGGLRVGPEPPPRGPPPAVGAQLPPGAAQQPAPPVEDFDTNGRAAGTAEPGRSRVGRELSEPVERLTLRFDVNETGT